jgi:type II secretion system protein N
MIEKKILIRRLMFAVYFIAAFLFFLFVLFPFDHIKTRLESEVRSRTSLELTVAHITPRFVNRFVLTDVVLSDRQGKVLFESPSVTTTLSLFSLLRGGVTANVTSQAYGGQLLIKMQQAPGRQYVMVDSDGLDIGGYRLLKDAGFKLTGKIGGNYEMTGDSGNGRIWVRNIASRQLSVKGFAVPDLDFDKGWLDLDVKGDRLVIRKLELDGKDLAVRATGDLVMREQGMLNITIRLKPSERMAHEQASMFSLLKDRDPEGYYQIKLGGTVANPLPMF